MDDPRRVRVPWYAWRWRLGLLFPTLLFALLALNSLNDIRAEPVLSVTFCTIFLAFALLLSRQLWRARQRPR
jgi:hypothetical protein